MEGKKECMGRLTERRDVGSIYMMLWVRVLVKWSHRPGALSHSISLGMFVYDDL